MRYLVKGRCIVVVYVVTSFIIGGSMDKYFELDWVNLYGPTRVVIKTNGRGRPRKEVVGIRAMQKRRKADGLSKGVGRPIKQK